MKWNVYVPKNRSQLSMSLSLLPPCIIRRFSHLVIWEELTDRKETEMRLAFNYNQATSWAQRHTQSDKNKQPIHFTLLPIPLRIPPCENYQFTPSLLPLSCVHKCLIWISLAPLPSNCLTPAQFRRSEDPGNQTHQERWCSGERAGSNGYEKIVEQTQRVVNSSSVWALYLIGVRIQRTERDWELSEAISCGKNCQKQPGCVTERNF